MENFEFWILQEKLYFTEIIYGCFHFNPRRGDVVLLAAAACGLPPALAQAFQL